METSLAGREGTINPKGGFKRHDRGNSTPTVFVTTKIEKV